jgi:hypothetical protein
MSALSEERAREEARRLRSMPTPPQIKPSGYEEEELEGRLREARPAPEALTRAVETLVGEQRAPLRVLQKPPLVKPQLTPRKLREMLRLLEPLRPGLIRIEGRAGAVLKLKSLRVQPPGTLKPGELQALVREQLRERPVLSPKPLKHTTPEVVASRPIARQPLPALKPLQSRTLRPGPPEVKEEEARAGEELRDFLELAFGGEGGRIRGRGPKVILFKDVEDDSYINFLEEICLRIYREIEGGKPKAKKLVKLDDLNKLEVEKWINAEGRIITIDLDRFDLSKISKESLRERLEETYSSGLGFVIFTTKSQKLFEKARGMLQEINFECQGRLNIVFLEARKLPLELVRLASGMLDLPEPVVRIRVGEVPSVFTFDYLINEALFKEDSAFNRALREVMIEEGGLFKSATARVENESDLHYAIKVFVVRCLVEELRKRGLALRSREEIERVVRTEVSEGEAIPDIHVMGGEVYEVETLFGEGESADKKLDETIRKYSYSGARVNVVMDNFGFLLHLKDLARVKRHYENVEFYTLDLKNKRLVSLNEFIEELRRVLSRAEMESL